jgi:hypothetical protein
VAQRGLLPFPARAERPAGMWSKVLPKRILQVSKLTPPPDRINILRLIKLSNLTGGGIDSNQKSTNARRQNNILMPPIFYLRGWLQQEIENHIEKAG